MFALRCCCSWFSSGFVLKNLGLNNKNKQISIIMSNCNNMSKNAEEKCIKRLAVFDFDCTVVTANTDDVVQQLLPNGPITEQERAFIKCHGWTKFMAKVFAELHAHKVTQQQICEKIRTIPEVPGMCNLLRTLYKEHNCELIIISDANSIFINEWLNEQQLCDCITQVFTNPAHFDEQGALQIKPYHCQTDCTLSAANLCKGKVLEEYLEQQKKEHNKQFTQLIYVGDGQNDICPALRLPAATDIACARKGMSMLKKLQKHPEQYKLKAELLVWENGDELLKSLEERFC